MKIIRHGQMTMKSVKYLMQVTGAALLITFTLAAFIESNASTATCTLQQNEIVVNREGGILRLSRYADVIIPSSTFEQDTKIKLLATYDGATDSDHQISMWIIDSYRRLPYEIRVRVGAKQPKEEIRLEIQVPYFFLAKAPKNHRVDVWAQIGDMDHFDGAPFTFLEKESKVVVQLPSFAFKKTRTGSKEEYEAVVIVGTSNATGVDERDEKIEQLSQDLEEEKFKVAELNAILSALRPPLEGEIISVAEINAVPENYMNKEIVLEGLMMGNANLKLAANNMSIGYFHLNDKNHNNIACYYDLNMLDVNSRRIMANKSQKQVVRVRGYLRQISKSHYSKTESGKKTLSWHKGMKDMKVFDVTKIEY